MAVWEMLWTAVKRHIEAQLVLLQSSGDVRSAPQIRRLRVLEEMRLKQPHAPTAESLQTMKFWMCWDFFKHSGRVAVRIPPVTDKKKNKWYKHEPGVHPSFCLCPQHHFGIPHEFWV